MTLLCGQGLAHATLAILTLQLGIANAATYPRIILMVILATNVITAAGAMATARRNRRELPEVATAVADPPAPPDPR
jgi:hypothetical protein